MGCFCQSWRRNIPFGLFLLLLLSYVTGIGGVQPWSRTKGAYHYGYSLVMSKEPFFGYGGEPFGVQPQLTVLYDDVVNTTFHGYLYAELEHSPTDLEALWYGNATAGPTNGQATVINGVATFDGLYLNEAGSYIIRFILRSWSNEGLAWILSDSMSVRVGRPYALGLLQYPGAASAGELFFPQPLVAILDRGGNVVKEQNAGRIYASARDLTTMNTTIDYLRPIGGTSVPIINGLGTFTNLYIDKEGVSYQIIITTSLELDGLSIINSLPFAVITGTYAHIALMHPISTYPIYSGEPFTMQPEIQVQDRGGNLVATDSSSKILVEMIENSERAQVLPFEQTFMPVINGSVNFTLLNVDQIGADFQMVFWLYSYDARTDSYSKTSIRTYSEYFSVLKGGVAALWLDTDFASSEKWAGGQPFQVPPTLRLVDGGGTAVTDGLKHELKVNMTVSPGYSRNLVIDATQGCPIVQATYVDSDHVYNDAYGVGEEILIYVYFSDDVVLDTSHGVLYLELNVTSLTNYTTNAWPWGYASMRHRKAYCINTDGRYNQLTFNYTVEEGDVSLCLDTVMHDSNQSAYSNMTMNRGRLTDVLGRPVSSSLPLPGTPKSLSRVGLVIETAQPVIGTVSTKLPSGKYGAGEVLTILVNYSRRVVVEGVPLLPIDVNWNHSLPVSYAVYVGGSGGYCLQFQYTVQPGDEITAFEVRRDLDILLGSHDVYSYYNQTQCVNNQSQVVIFNASVPLAMLSANTSGYYNCTKQHRNTSHTYPSAQILTASTHPIQKVNTTIDLALWETVVDTRQITLDTTAPHVDPAVGVYSSAPDGSYTAGDQLLIHVNFTKPVSVRPGVRLLLKGAYELITADYFSGDGTNQVTFVYEVLPFDLSPHLDTLAENAIVFVDGGYIRRQSSNPITDADVRFNPYDGSFAGLISTGKMLGNQSALSINAFPTVVTAVELDTTRTPDYATYGVDSTIYINVTFSTYVVIKGSPVLVLNVGQEREAVYRGGNLTKVATFEYVVQYGDEISRLGLRMTPNALCVASGCPSAAVVSSSSYIHQSSSNPIYSADLRLSLLGLPVDPQHKSSLLFCNVTISTANDTRPTTVLSVYTVNPSGDYGVGELIELIVTFTDEVRLPVDIPGLWTNLGKVANFSTGEGTDELHFFLQVDKSYPSQQLDFALVQGIDSALICYPPVCNITNIMGAPVNLSMTSVPPLPKSKNITISTRPPKVIDVYTLKNTSIYDGVYTVAEVIDINVIMDLPVGVFDAPRLEMQAGTVLPRYALYIPSISTAKQLVFRYIVQEGDSSADLTYKSRQALEVDTAESGIILRDATIPSQRANVTLPTPASLNPSYGQFLRINTIDIPYIINVSCQNVSGTYAPGDGLVITIFFSKTVVVTEVPYLYLDLTYTYRKAHYVGGSYSHILSFLYVVQQGDKTDDLTYVDHHSLQSGEMTDAKNKASFGSIRQVSMNPTVNARLDLPFPGSVGSLSFTSDISVDGAVPYITSIDYLEVDGTYQLGDIINVEVTFTAAVAVAGSPGILFETGFVDRQATYYYGSGTNVLIFQYQVRTGDFTALLEYWNEDSRYRSAATSFMLNGGWIRRASMNPILDADLHLNPPNSALRGELNCTSLLGIATFRKLWIEQRGAEYKVHFYANLSDTGLIFENSTSVMIDESAELEIRPDVQVSGELFGWSVSLDSDYLIVGAPASHKSVVEIQTIRTEGSVTESDIVYEVQVFGTQIDHVPEIQSFETSADPNEAVEGSFYLLAEDGSMTRAVEAVVTPAALALYISEDLPQLGSLVISRETNTYCACQNAYRWTITFLSLQGNVPPLLTLGTDLTGPGAAISSVTTLQNSPTLGGSFFLYMGNLTGRSIAYNAPNSVFLAALTEDLGLTVRKLDTQDSDVSVGRTWYVTFDALNEDYDIPPIFINDSGLIGNNARGWTHMGLEGQGPMTGFFCLKFRDSDWSSPLVYDATVEEVRDALESLPTIEQVSVQRRGPNDKRGYMWIVTFERINKWTPYGYVWDPVMGDLEAIQAQSLLIGNGTRVWVGDRPGLPGDPTPESPERAGTYGGNAGHVCVFKESKAKWAQTADFMGLDTDEKDRFGHDVALSLNGQRAIIGAPGADVVDPQVYLINCDALSGSFNLIWGNNTVGPIYHNVTQVVFLQMLRQARSRVMDFPIMRIQGWDIKIDGDGICSERSFNLLVEPQPSTTSDGINAETTSIWLTANSSRLSGTFSFNATSGSRQTKKLTVGAAYLFERSIASNESWSQVAKLTAAEGRPNDQMGWSVVQQGNYSLVGAPGADGDMGAAYLFKYNPITDLWDEGQKLTSSAWGRQPREKFGDKVVMGEGWLAVGAPGYNNASGAVYIYWYDRDEYLANQRIVPSDPQVRAEFGCSLAADGHQLVIGACHGTDEVIYLESDIYQPKTAAGSGAVYIYEFESSEEEFVYTDRLIGSNIKPYDQFGWQVRFSNQTILVSSLVSSDSTLRTRNAVQAITITATPWGKPVGSRFTVSWMSYTQGGYWYPRQSRPLQHNITADELAIALQEDLNTGTLSIDRSLMDPRTGGYTWTVTFREIEDHIEALQVSSKELTGSQVRAFVTVVNDPPLKVRGLVHVFAYDIDRSQWREQYYLYPSTKQNQDLFGYSLSLNGTTGRAIVGMPNRDTYYSGTNGGAIMVYNLDLLTVSFDQAYYEVSEGDPAVSVGFNRSQELSKSVPFKVWTIDRNANDEVQGFIKDIFDIINVPEWKTVTDMIGAGTATARSQYYGSNETRSLWVDGMYDYRALSDYVPTTAGLFLQKRQNSVSYEIKVNNDHILEKPDEDFLVAVTQKGIFPSPLGDLWRKVVIEDDGDGMPSTSLYSSYWKLEGQTTEAYDSFGTSTALHEESGLAVVGSPYAQEGNVTNVGTAYLFKRSIGGWMQIRKWVPTTFVGDSFFGQAVAISKAAPDTGRSEVTILISTPGRAQVYVYTSSNTTITWILDTILSAPKAFRLQHRFGAINTLALYGDIAVIGSPGIESVFVYERQWNVSVSVTAQGVYNTTYTSAWSAPILLRGSGYDYDVLQGNIFLHRRDFGASVAVSGRTLVVGAPQGNYPKQGTDYIELHKTDGEWHAGLAMGEVHVFYKKPEVWVIRMKADVMPYQGTWQVDVTHQRLTCRTEDLSFQAEPKEVQQALMDCPNLSAVEVSREDYTAEPDGGEVYLAGAVHGYVWSITFASELTEIDSLLPRWNGTGVTAGHMCSNCAMMSSIWSADPLDTYQAYQVQGVAEWEEETVLQASDKVPGDLFGYNLALDNEQLLVSALHSGALDYTTWDFETGTLQGWTKTGTAFDNQPTYGDNPIYRAPAYVPASLKNSGQGQQTGLQGRYFIGTYEKRPGNGAQDYQQASPIYSAGSIQGDEAVGTLTSQPFMIVGDRISFMIGGGCNPLTEYVELLVDGYSVARATGKCVEAMRRATWDVSLYINRIGQIRIVDASTARWAHINVDDFRFSWDMRGGRLASSGAKVSYAGALATPRAGAAYAFYRKDPLVERTCTGDRLACIWVEQTRLESSDKRPNQLFGYSISLDDAQGVAVIGAINAAVTGSYKEDLPFHPLDFNQSRVPFSLDPVYQVEMTSSGTFTPVSTGSRSVWQEGELITEQTRGIDPRYGELSGAIYVYHRSSEVYDKQGELLVAKQWSPVEQYKIQPPDIQGRDSFGYSASLSGNTLIVGAIGQDAFGQDAGAAYQYNLDFQRIYFTQPEFIALEGTDTWVELVIARDEAYMNRRTTVMYATSDLTAQAVDSTHFTACMRMDLKDRVGCGDYMQTTGQLIFSPGEMRKKIVIYIMDDACKGQDSKYAQVTLSIPGAGAILGEDYMTKIRIDDDDLDGQECV